MRSLFITVALVAAIALAGEYRTTTTTKKVQDGMQWFDLFSPPYSQCPTIMMAISCFSPTNCYLPAGQNGGGFNVYQFGGQPGGSFNPLNMPEPNMAMAIAMGGTAEAPHGIVGGIGFGNGVQYAANTTTFLPSTTPEFMVVTQNVRTSADGMENLVIDNANGNAVLFSNDGGKNFSLYNINSPVPEGAGARYGALINSQEWFVTLGNWPSSKKGDLNAHMYVEKNQRKFRKMSLGNQTGYSAAIAYTGDGGKTWTTQYSSTTDFYFNGMDCSSATNCVAVGEGFDENAAAHIFHTGDGKTWTEVMTIPSTSSSSYSLMSVKFSDKDTVWIGGSEGGVFNSKALLMESKDGGKTWTKAVGPENIGVVTDISFTPGGIGFATAVTVYQDSTILKYATAPAPTPAPPVTPAPPMPNGTFVQQHCTDSACTQGCQNTSFPEGQCLQVSGGGSAIVKCTPTELVETLFASTTDCTGTNQSTSMPLNQCLQGSGGYFENICPSSVSAKLRNLFWHRN